MLVVQRIEADWLLLEIWKVSVGCSKDCRTSRDICMHRVQQATPTFTASAQCNCYPDCSFSMISNKDVSVCFLGHVERVTRLRDAVARLQRRFDKAISTRSNVRVECLAHPKRASCRGQLHARQLDLQPSFCLFASQ